MRRAEALQILQWVMRKSGQAWEPLKEDKVSVASSTKYRRKPNRHYFSVLLKVIYKATEGKAPRVYVLVYGGWSNSIEMEWPVDPFLEFHGKPVIRFIKEIVEFIRDKRVPKEVSHVS